MTREDVEPFIVRRHFVDSAVVEVDGEPIDVGTVRRAYEPPRFPRLARLTRRLREVFGEDPTRTPTG